MTGKLMNLRRAGSCADCAAELPAGKPVRRRPWAIPVVYDVTPKGYRVGVTAQTRRPPSAIGQSVYRDHRSRVMRQADLPFKPEVRE